MAEVAATFSVAATAKLAHLLLRRCLMKSPWLHILTALVAGAAMAVIPHILRRVTVLRASLGGSAADAHCLGPSVIVRLLRNP
jgi:hypothetical protein